MSKLNIIGWVLMLIAILLFVHTISTKEMDISVRAKAEATGGTVIRDIGHENRHTVWKISGVAFCAGMACFLIDGGLEKLRKKRRIRNAKSSDPT